MKFHNVSFKKTKGGTWYTRIRKNGQQYYVSAPTQNKLRLNLKEFLKRYDETVPRIENGVKHYTLAQYYKLWLEIYKKDVKATTKRSYNVAYKRLTKEFVNKLLERIGTIEAVEELRRFDGLRSSQQMYVLLKDIFNKAFKERLINTNPLENVPLPKYTPPERRVMDKQQQEKFITACKVSKYGDFFLLALFQGLRRGEILMLKPNDIDFENSTLRIDESITDTSDETTTKNKFSNRTMPLFERTKVILEKYMKFPADERIFKVSSTVLSEHLTKILAVAGIPKFTTHELRHTFITFCRDNNVPEHVVQKWVGHQIGSKVTSKTYTHVTDETSKRYTDLLNKI